MARLVSDAVTEVGIILNDVAGARYTPADVIRYVNAGVIEARSLRPDLFVGAYATPPGQVTLVGDTIPLPDQLFTTLCYYIAGRCELRDDEFAVDGRAMTLIPTFGKKLVQGG